MSHGRNDVIEAMRGLAVALVIAYHLGWAHGGFVGVDVFFVISGFVVASSIRRRRETEAFRISTFLGRRIARLGPALALLLIFVALTAPLLGPIGSLGVTRQTGLAATAGGANLYLLANRVAYGQLDNERNALLHTWSLGVEEQAYLAAAVATAACLRLRLGRSLIRRTLLISVAASAFIWWALADPTGTGAWWPQGHAFFNPAMRIWQLGLGGWLALHAPAPWRPHPAWGWGGVASIGLGAILADSIDGRAGVVAATLGAALAVRSAPAGETAAFLRPAVALGGVSYSLYLWHWPLLVYSRALDPSRTWLPELAAVALAIALATCSTRYLERPLRSSIERRRVVVGSGLAALTAAGLFVVAPLNPLAFSAPGADTYRLQLAPHPDETSGCRWQPLRDAPDGPCEINPEGNRTVALIGDSTAGQLMHGLAELAVANDFRVVVATAGGCPAADVDIMVGGAGDRCRRFVSDNLRDAGELGASVVVLSTATPVYVGSDEFGLGRGHALVDETAEKASLVIAGIGRTTQEAADLDLAVLYVEPVLPIGSWNARACAGVLAAHAPNACAVSRHLHDRSSSESALLEAQRDAVTGAGGVTVDLSDALCPGGECRTRDDAVGWLRRDAHHLSIAGSELAGDMLVRTLEDILNQPMEPS